MSNAKPPILPIASAAQILVAALEGLDLGTRVERSNASNSSLYVYAFHGDGSPELKIRVSNHPLRKSAALRHRAPDFELVLPDGRGEASTNTVEGVFSIFKRGMIGTYQHCGEQHLQRYLAEFDFRYSNRAALEIDDVQRTKKVLAGIVGKRLTYRRPNEAANA